MFLCIFSMIINVVKLAIIQILHFWTVNLFLSFPISNIIDIDTTIIVYFNCFSVDFLYVVFCRYACSF